MKHFFLLLVLTVSLLPLKACSQTEATPLQLPLDGAVMNKIAIAALIVSLLSLVGNGVLLWLLKNLARRFESQKKDIGTMRQIYKTVQNQASTLSAHHAEFTRLAQRLHKIEELTRSASANSSMPDYPVDNAQILGVAQPKGLEFYPSSPQSVSPSPARFGRDAAAGYAAEYPTPHFSPSPYANIVAQYNSQTDALERTATGVAETASSLERRRLNSETNQVTLEQANNPSYWVIPAANQEGWLVPKPGLKIRMGNIETFGKLFDILGDPNNQEFQLISPAQVTFIPSINEWELDTKGVVQF